MIEMEGKNDEQTTATDSPGANNTGKSVARKRATGKVVMLSVGTTLNEEQQKKNMHHSEQSSSGNVNTVITSQPLPISFTEKDSTTKKINQGTVNEEEDVLDNKLSLEQKTEHIRSSSAKLNPSCGVADHDMLKKTNLEGFMVQKDTGSKGDTDPNSTSFRIKEVVENLSKKSFYKTQSFLKTKEDEEKTEQYVAYEVYNNNLDEKAKDQPKIEESSTKVSFRFRSGNKKTCMERDCTVHGLKKWEFLMSPKELKNNIRKQLELIQSEIAVRKRGPFAFDICSENHEHDFNQWVETCLELIINSFNDLELLAISGSFGEIQHLSKKIKQSNAVLDGSVSVYEMKDVCGEFLLGEGEHIIDLLSDLETHIKNAKVWNPESRKDISYDVFELNTFQLRLNSMFKGTEKATEEYPLVKIYKRGDKVMLIGHSDECSAASDYIRTNAWLTDIQQEESIAMQGLQFFLKREGVQKYIDSKITLLDGTWAVVEHPDSPNIEMVMKYGKTETALQEIEKKMQASVSKIQCSNINSKAIEGNTIKWQDCVKKLEETFEGKIHMEIHTEKNLNKYVATIVFTSDLQDEENLRMLVHDVEQQVSRKDLLTLNQKRFKWLQKFYLEDIEIEASKNDTELKIEEEKGVIEITGATPALTGIKKFIDSICVEERDILLPFNALPSEASNFLRKKKCCYDHHQDRNSKCSMNGKTAFVVHKGKMKTENLFADVNVKSLLSENKDLISNIRWIDDKSAALYFPLWQGGEKREEQQMNSALRLLFTDIIKYKKKSVMFELEDLSTWPVQTFVKCIIQAVHEPKPLEGLIIILCHENETAYNSVGKCIGAVSQPLKDLQNAKIELQVISGKIAELQEKVDVIVNTTSLNLDLTHGAVSNSILNAAGDGLKMEIAEIPVIDTGGKSTKKIEYGDVRETSAYRLKCERIFHGALFPWNDGKDMSLEVLQKFVKSCIVKADERKFQTIAFPAIGTGQLKIPADVVASCVKKLVDEYVALHPQTFVQKILFVIYETDEENFKVFKTILEHEKDNVEDNTATILYRFSVCGEKDNVITAMQLLEGLFCEHIKERYESARSVQKQEHTPTSQHESGKDIDLGVDMSQLPPTVALENESKYRLSFEDHHCLMLRSKKEVILTVENLGPILKDVEYENIICPFLEDVCALLRFRSVKDAETFFKKFSYEEFVLTKLPIQAVTNVKAKLGSKVTSILQGTCITSHYFQEKTGAYLCTESWTVEGNLLMVKNAERYLKEVVKKENGAPSLSEKGNGQNEHTSETIGEVPRKYSVKCTKYQEKALKDLFPDLLFQNVNFQDELGGKVIRGTEKNVKPFEKALFELKMKEIPQVTVQEFKEFEKDKKKDGVSVSFVKETSTMIIFSRIPEILQSCLLEFKKLQSSSLEIPVGEFDVISYFEKSLHVTFLEKDGKVIISGSGSLVEKYKSALDNIRQYTKEHVTVSSHAEDSAADFLSRFSSANENVYTRMTGNIIYITGPNAETVKKAKHEVERINQQNIRYPAENVRIQKRHRNSTDFSRTSKGDLPRDYSNPVSPQKSDIVFEEKGVKVYALKADITRVNTDVIVNPSNKTLQSLGGLSSYIYKEAGQSVLRQCSDFIKSQKDGIIPIGKPFVTAAGTLKYCQKIIHVNVPKWRNYAESENPCEDCISDIVSTVQACLSQLNDVNSIAIPTISAGAVGSVPLPVCCRAYAKAVNSFVITESKKSKLKEIYFVDTDQTKLQGIKNSFSHTQHWIYHKKENENDYYLGSGMVVKIFAGEIIFSKADGLVIEQGKDMKSKRNVASKLMQCKSDEYENEMSGLSGRHWTVGDVRSTTAPRTLPNIQKVLHVFSPNWSLIDNTDSQKQLLEDLEICIKKIFKKANNLKLKTIVIPLFGRGIPDKNNKRKIFQCTATTIVKCGTENRENTLQAISIVDNFDVNIAHMNAQFYEVLSQDAEQRNKVKLIDVARPNRW